MATAPMATKSTLYTVHAPIPSRSVIIRAVPAMSTHGHPQQPVQGTEVVAWWIHVNKRTIR
jgi:hypothetical protein